MTTDRPGFYGYRRRDGRVGTRNHVLVVPTVICSSLVAERVAAAAPPFASALPHLAGCGQLGPDMRVTHETLAAYCGAPQRRRRRRHRARMRAGRRASAGRGGARPRQAGRHRGDPVGGGHGARDGEGQRHRAIVRGAAGRRRSANGATCPSSCCRSSAADRTTRPGWRRTRRWDASRIGSSSSAGAPCSGEIAEIMGAEHLLASTSDAPGDRRAADSDHHARRGRGAGARARHPRHAAVARQHPRRPDDDRGEVARRHAQRRGARAARGRRALRGAASATRD